VSILMTGVRFNIGPFTAY